MDTQNSFMPQFNGYFKSILKWDQFDDFWLQLANNPSDDWYIYAIGEAPPVQCASTDKFQAFLISVAELLHRDHHEKYCGIVYVDDFDSPEFIKIYDPNNLGSVCGSSSHPPPLPGWIISKVTPVDLEAGLPQTGSRRRWWERIFNAA
jgi:hypothetical protein